ncbi:hypothetical protein BCR36DRAFT_328249 [Piromyces finnis]|uniref:RGS domain-containing protein n=1 Tax=Piromyces finnis TaxID=1754191 RepID=A0A1Y1V8J5_9FUNG|nr:hypothetical protein BCR36DRAFT_328249 [Piromyces finnis]|eukprot:ORX49234.1 hypothetical protein BCR36DRAFT_328249 [Piromyces finnis]
MKRVFKYATDNEIKYYTKLNDKEKDDILESNSYNGISEKIKYHMFVLPSLKECLENKTHAPFCTFNFNIWLKEVESMDNYLDFLLDLISHKRLIQAYQGSKEFASENINSSSSSPSFKTINSNKELSNILNHRLNNQNNIFRNNEMEYNSDNIVKTNSEQDITNLNISFPGNNDNNSSVKQTIKRNITEKDLLYSAKLLFQTYIVNENHSKNIEVSSDIIKDIERKIYKENQWYYELFEDIYQQALYILNVGPYQRFLIKRIKSNVSRKHSLIRFILGLLLFFIVIVNLFLLVFYKSSRFLRIFLSYIPLFISLHSISVYVNDFDFIIGFLGKSISGYFDIIDIRDGEIINFHKWKSKRNFFIVLFLDIVISTIFVLI